MSGAAIRGVLCAIAFAMTGCATARLSGPPPIPPPELQPPPVVVVLEPFFENARVESREVVTRTGDFDPVTMQSQQVVAQVQQKPIYAQLHALIEEHQQVLEEIQRLRPSWKVISTGELPSVTGPVRMIRVVVGDHEIAGSDRAFKRIATGFGVVIWPLLLVNVTPVTETDRVRGTVSLYASTSEVLRARLLKYPTQADFAVDTRGLGPVRVQPVSFDLEYQEGLWADENARPPVLLQGFSEHLAVAVVALVEGIQ